MRSFILHFSTIYPDFYADFSCKADKCQHTCCAGWEIDIDAATTAKYQQLEGALGEKIRQNSPWLFQNSSFPAKGTCAIITL